MLISVFITFALFVVCIFNVWWISLSKWKKYHVIFQNKIKYTFIRNSIRTYALGIIKPRINLNKAVAAFPLRGLGQDLGDYSFSVRDQECCGYSDDDVWSP